MGFKELFVVVLYFLYFHMSRSFKSQPSVFNIRRIGKRFLPYQRNVAVHGEISSSLLMSAKFIPVGKHSFDKRNLYFIPGFDGAGDYSISTVRSLSANYNVWRMEISSDDRSTFTDLSDIAISALKNGSSPSVLVGESFGGLLSTYITAKASEYVSQLVLVNPATSIDKSIWPNLVPVLTNTGPAFPVVGLASLGVTGFEPSQIMRYADTKWSEIKSTQSALSEIINLLGAGVKIVNLLSRETVDFRFQNWLLSGLKLVEKEYDNIKSPVLVIVGKNDRVLPSAKEGKRLKKVLRKADRVDLVEIPNAGHAVLDGSFNLLETMLSSVVFKSNYSIYDNIFPTQQDIAESDKVYGPIRSAASPIFLTRSEDGALRRGIKTLPTGQSGRPVLFVGNHQFMGLDLSLIVREFLIEKSCLVRGLAHPIIFQNVSDLKDTYVKFGAVPVSPMSYYELLKRNETILLFPGGAREALHLKGEDYQLFWPDKVDFIRMATLMDAIVVPFAAIGASDSVNIIYDSEETLNLPIVGNRLKKALESIPQARSDRNDTMAPPLAIPKLPSRFYFLFDKPIDTRALGGAKKTQVKLIYDNIRKSIEDNIDMLLKFRADDPYNDFTKRSAYELLSQDQAPTADIYDIKWRKVVDNVL